MLTAFLSAIYVLVGTKSYEEAKENSFFRKLIFVYAMIARTVLTYPVTILLLSEAKAIFDNHSDSNSYILIGIMVIGSLLYFFTLYIAFSLLSLPILDNSLPWTNISGKNAFLREFSKILVSAQMLFI